MRSVMSDRKRFPGTVVKTASLTLFAFFLLSLSVSAQTLPAAHNNALILGSGQTEYHPGPQMLRFEDTEGWMNAATMLRKLAEKNLETEGLKTFITVSPSKSPTWLAFKYYNNSNRVSWVLDFGSALDGRVGLADKITVFTYTAPAVDPSLTEEEVQSRVEAMPFPP